jgi:TonB family protein
MKLAITPRIRTLFDRYWVRITVGVLLSLLVHGFILSLQLGIPGLGLPGLALPWDERRAQTPELRIQITNLAGSPTVMPQVPPLPPKDDATTKPQQALQQPSNNQPITELPNAHVKQTPSRSASPSPQVAKALKSTPAIAQALRKNGAPPPDDQSSPAPERSQPELIALADNRGGSFVVPAPDLDEWWRTAPIIDDNPTPTHSLLETATPAIAMHSPKQSVEQATEPTPALQKPAEHESFERPDDTLAKEPTPPQTSDVAMEQAARKQGEEIAQQEAARKLEEQEALQRAQDLENIKQEEARKQEAEKAASLLAAQKIEEEQATRRAEELALKKREDAKRQELADAELQAKELEAHRQAEEITRQQAAALALQKQIEQKQAEEIKKQEQAMAERQALELAAQKQAEELARQKAAALERQQQEEQATRQASELAARQRADAAQRDNARMAAAGSSGKGDTGGTSGLAGAANLSRGPHAGNLASNALEQIEKADLMRGVPSLAAGTDQPEESSRRRSIFGSIDHDVALAMYIEGWRAKIERNGNLNYSQSSTDKARESPVVTVSIRSDGSVEDVIINRSSGRADLDEAVRRIVRVNARYSVFPDNLAQKYDVIEIRRVWNFDERIRIQEEVR